MSNAQLSAHAIRGLCDDNFVLDDIDCLVASSSQPDQVMPNHAVMVHGELESAVRGGGYRRHLFVWHHCT